MPKVRSKMVLRAKKIIVPQLVLYPYVKIKIAIFRLTIYSLLLLSSFLF